MKKSRYSEERIVKILRETLEEKSVKEVCEQHNISEATYYKWKKKYGGMEVSNVRQMRAMAEENNRLKKIVADQAIQIDILKAVNAKKW